MNRWQDQWSESPGDTAGWWSRVTKSEQERDEVREYHLWNWNYRGIVVIYSDKVKGMTKDISCWDKIVRNLSRIKGLEYWMGHLHGYGHYQDVEEFYTGKEIKSLVKKRQYPSSDRWSQTKEQRQFNGERIFFSTNSAGTTGHPC